MVQMISLERILSHNKEPLPANLQNLAKRPKLQILYCIKKALVVNYFQKTSVLFITWMRSNPRCKLG